MTSWRFKLYMENLHMASKVYLWRNNCYLIMDKQYYNCNIEIFLFFLSQHPVIIGDKENRGGRTRSI